MGAFMQEGGLVQKKVPPSVKQHVGTTNIKAIEPSYGKTIRGPLARLIAKRRSGDTFVGQVNDRYD